MKKQHNRLMATQKMDSCYRMYFKQHEPIRHDPKAELAGLRQKFVKANEPKHDKRQMHRLLLGGAGRQNSPNDAILIDHMLRQGEKNQDSTIYFDLNGTQLSDSLIPAGRRSKAGQVAERTLSNKTKNLKIDANRHDLVNLQEIIG